MLNFIVNAAIEGGSIETAAGWSFSNLGNLITAGIQAATLVAGLLSLGFLIFGGITYITASGDKIQTEKAMKTLTSAIVGLVIVVAAFAIVNILGNTLGLKITGPIRWPSVTQAPGNGEPPPPEQRTCPNGDACRGTCAGWWECRDAYGGEWYCETDPANCGTADRSQGACCRQ